jgi:hypothetical protein
MKLIPAALAALLLAAGITIGGHHCYQSQPYVIRFSPGGVISDFIEEYDNLRRSGRHVVIDSLCLSACTLVVGLVPADRICTTPYGRLGFHSAWYMTMVGPRHSSEGTRLLWQMYPESLRMMLRERGFDGGSGPDGNEHPDLIYIDNDDLLTIVRRCDG